MTEIGHPAEQVVRYAEGHGIDHIVVGRDGREAVRMSALTWQIALAIALGSLARARD